MIFPLIVSILCTQNQNVKKFLSRDACVLHVYHTYICTPVLIQIDGIYCVCIAIKSQLSVVL